ncbi:MAG: hypothetical protein A2315_13850 [Ignavibacteria bacterium RIFOXYB2_FULL_35_12]|nr:MAG: hypothetical protein A2058_15540 [Ignavibacteria bacterium GWA2_36_19]OGU50072.1 MAG: hypothetical protein A2006_13060 [Ignavibacteria bacterium GWC2_35_8]OGU61319.1 MAG: hypothetical protein A2X60_08810 [Ignavibacteria bacterium GWF2_35_20]OGU80226.1 MAG: hypothetical protein A2254_04270 [Ignavibacteria bacterium RIFOXYA2_FULL_35_9]OGU88470.1 MAG: hypothetical protein A3K31_10670 [Ignavibacteria bacterium RIFOXYA12_FULL_35_25]OGU92443.1 MAG: hypothetical protein A2492_04510 [Ignavibac
MVLKLRHKIIVMKSLIIFFLILLCTQNSFSQSAQSYFPSQTGFKWTYRVTPLDSVNNPISSLTYYQVDSFAVIQNYQGKTANYIVSKSGSEFTLPFQPYLDTSYLSFLNNDAFKYYRLFNFDSLLGGIGNRNVRSTQPFEPDNIEAFEGWFAYYRFAQTVNINYQIFSKDTSITFDTLNFPVRYELKGKRLADQTVTTPLGTFNCKKFLLTTVLNYLPFPFLPIPLYTTLDTTWIAQGYWVVKQIMPSSVVNLSAIGFPTFTIPGSMKEIIPALVTEVEEEQISPKDFYLSQNYPNPFNPSTTIRYAIPSANSPLLGGAGGGYVTLKVYDALGNEVATLVDEYKTAGSYEVEFQSSMDNRQLASGVYYYQLRLGNFTENKKMVLIK